MFLARDADDGVSWGDHEHLSAIGAGVVLVHAVVGLLFAHVLQRFVPALGHEESLMGDAFRSLNGNGPLSREGEDVGS